jgi:6-pyruvoyltetrahydropterin/6-carboxytetrahydropterin synthase
MIFITRRAEFSAAHTLADPDLSQEENERIFGPCAHPHGHGHNYVLEVTLAGDVNPRTGMVIDLKELKRIMEEQVISKVDHRNLNCDPDFLRGVIPTAENVAMGCFEVLDRALPGGLLYRVRLYESPRNFVDYYGSGGPRPRVPEDLR